MKSGCYNYVIKSINIFYIQLYYSFMEVGGYMLESYFKLEICMC